MAFHKSKTWIFPQNKDEQNETLIYHLLSELRKAGLIEANGKIWLQKKTVNEQF